MSEDDKNFEDADKAYIWSGVRKMLDSFLAADRKSADDFIHQDATMWDSVQPKLIVGLDGLNALRDARPASAGPSNVAEIMTENPVIDIYGDIAVLRYELVVRFKDGSPDENIRNSAVWRRFPEGWLVIHNHEDVLPLG